MYEERREKWFCLELRREGLLLFTVTYREGVEKAELEKAVTG